MLLAAGPPPARAHDHADGGGEHLSRVARPRSHGERLDLRGLQPEEVGERHACAARLGSGGEGVVQESLQLHLAVSRHLCILQGPIVPDMSGP